MWSLSDIRGRENETRRKNREGERIGVRKKMDVSVFFSFFFSPLLLSGFSITFAAWKWYRVLDIWELEIPMDLIIVDIFFLIRADRFLEIIEKFNKFDEFEWCIIFNQLYYLFRGIGLILTALEKEKLNLTRGEIL